MKKQQKVCREMEVHPLKHWNRVSLAGNDCFSFVRPCRKKDRTRQQKGMGKVFVFLLLEWIIGKSVIPQGTIFSLLFCTRNCLVDLFST